MANPDGHRAPDDPRDDTGGEARLNPGPRRPVLTGRNRLMVQWFGGLIMISLLIAGQASMPLAIALLSAVLLVASGSTGLIGLFAEDRPAAEHFTRWDLAAWLAVLSVLVGYFADRTAGVTGITLTLF